MSALMLAIAVFVVFLVAVVLVALLGGLSPEVIDLAVTRLLAKFDQPQEDIAATRKRLSAALQVVEKELSRLEHAIAGGDAPATLVGAIRDRERAQKDLLAQIKGLDASPAVVAAEADIRRDARALLADWRALLRQHLPIARQAVRKLLGPSRFVFYPSGRGNRRVYELGVAADLTKFLGAIPSLKKAASPPCGTPLPSVMQGTPKIRHAEICGILYVIVIHRSPLLSDPRSQYSVSTAFLL
jgi:hypothetical protein